MSLTVCSNCGNKRKHYAKGLCRSCYMRALRHGFSVEELAAYDNESRIRKENAHLEKQRVQNLHSIGLGQRPRTNETIQLWDWYYNTNKKELLFTFPNIDKRNSAFNTIYAAAIRRRDLPIIIKRKRLTMKIERIMP